jgi:multiple sugar transport system permease protein
MTVRTRQTPLTLRVSTIMKQTLLYAILVLGAFFVTFPFLWMILTSFKNFAEAIAIPPTLWPKAWVVRVRVLGAMLDQHPGTLALFAAWLCADIVVAWKVVRGRAGKAIYFIVHLLLFFVLGNIGLFGADRNLSSLWEQAAARVGAELAPFWENYVEAWGYAPFAHYFRNSFLTATGTCFLIVVTGVPAAYAFARMRFPGKDFIFLAFLATMMIPREVLVIPNYVTVSQLGWIDTFFALIVPWIVSVMSIFFLRQFFMSVPDDLYDAALLDGCGHIRFLWHIALRLSAPALVSTTLFNFLGSWNSLLWPLLVTNSPKMRPIMVGMAYFSDEFGMEVQLHNAAATFTALPIIVLFLFIQRQFIEGIARTGIK